MYEACGYMANLFVFSVRKFILIPFRTSNYFDSENISVVWQSAKLLEQKNNVFSVSFHTIPFTFRLHAIMLMNELYFDHWIDAEQLNQNIWQKLFVFFDEITTSQLI